MYIFEGRGKGATWSLLLEALHNQGVYITTESRLVRYVKDNVLQEMREQGLISLDGVEYLFENCYTLEEWQMTGRRGHPSKPPVYMDLALPRIQELLERDIGYEPEVIALGNSDQIVVHPKQIKEMNNTFVTEQRQEFGR